MTARGLERIGLGVGMGMRMEMPGGNQKPHTYLMLSALVSCPAGRRQRKIVLLSHQDFGADKTRQTHINNFCSGLPS